MISPILVEANYEVLKSLLRERRRQRRNEDLRTELEYRSEEYDEEREMEPRPTRVREAIPILQAAPSRIQRQKERVDAIEDAPNREGSRVERNDERGRYLGQRTEDNGSQGMNLPPLLAAHLGRNENGETCGKPTSHPSRAQGEAPPSEDLPPITPMEDMLRKPSQGASSPYLTGLCTPQDPSGLFADYTGCVIPFVSWIEDYPFPDGLKMPSHVRSCDGKGDPDNFLHLFEGAIRMQKWAMPMACHMFTYTLKDSAQIWWNGQKTVHNIKQKEGESTRAFVTRYTDDTLQILGLREEQRIFGFVHGLRTRSLVEFLSTDLPTIYKGLMEKTYTWIKAKEFAINGTPNDRRENFKRFKRDSSWDNNKGKRNRDRFSSYHGANHGLLSNLSKSPREILAIEKVAKTFEQPTRMIGIRRSRNMTKRAKKVSDTQHGDRKKENKETAPVEAPILMISRQDQTQKRKSAKEPINRLGEITFPPVSVIYKNCFLKLNPALQSLRVDSQVPLVGFSGEHFWPLGEVPLKITIGDGSLTRTEVLNFVIIRSNSPYNLLLGRTAMQRMGIVVSKIYGAIKFHTPKGIGTMPLTYKPLKRDERKKKSKATCPEIAKNVLSCGDAKERIIVNTKYPEQTVAIGMRLPTNIKERLHELLIAIVDIFVWTYADMTGILRTIIVGGKSFNTEHKLNEYKHIKPIKQKKRGLGSDYNEATCREVEELPKAGILRKVKNQTWVANPVMVESLLGFRLKCFLDAYKGYHQIQMADDNEDKTAFFACKEVFCYRKMPFGLKNAGATYQRLVDKVFGDQIGRNLKAYVDDMKTQIPKDFSIEIPLEEGKKVETRRVDTGKEGPKLGSIWKLYTDRALSSNGSGAGLMLISPEGREYTYALRFEFKTTNNGVEYEALLAGLWVAREMEIKSLAIFTDSQLMAN
ncbi:reverse transcriptase domain-containing protein [Tanacetum coccineum]